MLLFILVTSVVDADFLFLSFNSVGLLVQPSVGLDGDDGLLTHGGQNSALQKNQFIVPY